MILLIPGMVTVSSNLNKLSLLSISYDKEESQVTYIFSLASLQYTFLGIPIDIEGVRGIQFSDDMERFMEPFYMQDRLFAQKIMRLSWNCINGEPVNFPYTFFQ